MSDSVKNPAAGGVAQTKKKRGAGKGHGELPYSDLDLANWKERDDVLTDSLWEIPSRSRKGGHQLEYHGNYVPQIATQLFQRFTKRGDVVLDPFLGAGTTAIEAARMGRRCVGVELQPRLIKHVRGRVPDPKTAVLLAGDSAAPETPDRVRRALRDLDAEHAQLVILHPPYKDIIRFSDLPGDLSRETDTDAFLKSFSDIARWCLDLLEPGRFAAVIIGDKYENSEVTPLGFLCMHEMMNLGARLKGIVIKNITGNERGKGKNANLWRYRALAFGFYIFKHEYVLVFRKDG